MNSKSFGFNIQVCNTCHNFNMFTNALYYVVIAINVVL